MAVQVRRVHTPLRARLRFAGYAGRLLVGRLLVLTILLVVGGATLLWRGDPAVVLHLDFVGACFLVYTQLFFEHLTDLPSDWVLRIMYFTVPVAGAFIIAEGLLKVGTSLMDFNNHRQAWVRIMAEIYRCLLYTSPSPRD